MTWFQISCDRATYLCGATLIAIISMIRNLIEFGKDTSSFPFCSPPGFQQRLEPARDSREPNSHRSKLSSVGKLVDDDSAPVSESGENCSRTSFLFTPAKIGDSGYQLRCAIYSNEIACSWIVE